MTLSPVATAAFLLVVGTIGGAVTSAGAISTLISYPALLAVGLSPLAANVTNSVAVVGTGLTSTLASGPELRGTGRRLLTGSVLSVLSSLVGAALLLLTPDDAFAWVAPFLIAAASVVLLLQPRISAAQLARTARTGRDPALLLPYGLVGVGIYNGYFGAASGIMLLAVLMLTVESRLVHANALKNVLLGVADAFVAVAFVLFGPVRWAAAVPLGIGFLIGGAIGPSVARRVPAGPLRLVISLAGIGVSIWLLISVARS